MHPENYPVKQAHEYIHILLVCNTFSVTKLNEHICIVQWLLNCRQTYNLKVHVKQTTLAT